MRHFISTTGLNWDSAGFTSRSLNGWVLANSTLSSWKQFYHQPYQCDWKEATQKAIECKQRDSSYQFNGANYAISGHNQRDRNEKEKEQES